MSQYLPPASPLRVNINRGWEYVRIINNSPYLLNVSFGGPHNITLPEMYLEDIRIPTNSPAWIVITPNINLAITAQSVSNSISVNAFQKGELDHPQAQPLTQQAVNVTAAGKPLFSVSTGYGSTATKNQWINIFNPPTSGINYIFHSSRILTNDATLPSSNIYLISGADLNIGTTITPISHSGKANPPVSTAHATAADSATDFSGGSLNDVEVLNIPANTQADMLLFPDTITLYPGNNLLLGLFSGTTAHTVRETLKWTEDIFTPQVGGVNLGTIANQIINDGNPLQQVLEATKSGDSPSDISITNDGTITIANNARIKTLDTGGILHTLLYEDASNNVNLRSGGSRLIQFQDNEANAAALLASVSNSQFHSLIAALFDLGVNVNGQLQLNQAGTAVSGSVSGTCTFYAPLWGNSLKVLIVSLNNYQSAGVASFNLPSAITFYMGMVSNLGASQTFGMFQSGVAQNMFQFVGSATLGSPGTQSASETTMHGSNTFYGVNAASQIQVGSNTAAIFAVIVIIGV